MTLGMDDFKAIASKVASMLPGDEIVYYVGNYAGDLSSALAQVSIDFFQARLSEGWTFYQRKTGKKEFTYIARRA